ncbi:P-loop containing nucleoside triphosphate hydrolase protein [Dunaliella salina]|uniref:P-loop containing nucleoside triphosphate hydrolase protein n=1 Tax=Dunaliella salina TaxID=3046 RepID=A0ABQ7HA95_DUNSA|nr:P-loop containing nucleoside triphosphate hydrolase protein [Dunaliella salina]|eukprot:KAF5843773.1 P-loop containing nucleoside triphosphate hydrolase protein [Dunaliella salina]
MDGRDQDNKQHVPAAEEGGLSVPARPVFRAPPPRTSMLGLDKLASQKRAESERESKRVKLTCDQETDAANPEAQEEEVAAADLPMSREGGGGQKGERRFRTQRVETPSHPGGVTAQARESLASHRDRHAGPHGRGALYNTTAEERERRHRGARDDAQQGSGSGRSSGRYGQDEMRASDVRLQSELDRFRSRAPSSRGTENGSASGSGGSRSSREGGERRRDERRDEQRGGKYERAERRDREAEGSGRDGSYERPRSGGSSARSSADWTRGSERGGSRGRTEREREKEWERDADVVRPGSSGRGSGQAEDAPKEPPADEFDEILRREHELDERQMERDWYDQEEFGGAADREGAEPFVGDENFFQKRAADLQKRTRKDGKTMSLAQTKRTNELEKDMNAWEENRLLTSGVARLKEINLDFDADDDSRVLLLVHDTKPPFLEGKVVGMRGGDIVLPLKDPTSDMAVIARKGSELVKRIREKKESTKSRARFWEMAGSKMAEITGLTSTEQQEAQQAKEAAKAEEEEEDEAGGHRSQGQFKAHLAKMKAESASKKAEGASAFSREKTIGQQRRSLPVYTIRDELMQVIRENQVVVVVGETGSGKTTQMTQYLNEEGYGKSGVIGCTQPRRVAAMSVAKRVSEEMDVELGEEVGYSIRFEDCTSKKTIIKYMTDGVLLRETLVSDDLDNYSVVVMDEAHERGLNTGQEEIEATCFALAERLEQMTSAGQTVPELMVLPIYSTLPSDLQAKIFDPAPEGTRKCIVSTNIAETSLTVDGILYVVDTGYVKMKVYNPKMGMDALQVFPISQAAAGQRSGRAGRTGPGTCYRLYTEPAYRHEMLLASVPEIQRTNLANVVLLLKSLNVQNLLEFGFMDPPPQENILNSMYQLWVLGALDNTGWCTTWCDRHYLHAKGLRKAKEVRQQLMDILVQQKIKMTTAGHEWDIVRKAICSAYFQNAAKFKSIGEYVNCRTGMPAHMHPSSALYGLGFTPDYVVYHELVMTSKEYMQCVTAVEPEWLAELGPMFFSIKDTHMTRMDARKKQKSNKAAMAEEMAVVQAAKVAEANRQLAKAQEIRNRERESIATPGSRPATTPGTSAARKRVLGL